MTDNDGNATGSTATANVKPSVHVDLPSYKSFEIVGSDADEIAARWKKWKRGLDFYIEAIGIDKTLEKARLKNMVLYLLGEDCQDIYVTLNDIGDSYDSVLETLNSYFIPPCNVSYERHVFNSCKQEKGEMMDIYVTRLRVLAKTCDFGNGIEERIRDQVVQGCFSDALRKSFLKTENLTLVIILKKAKVVEISESQIKQMKNEGKEEVYSIKRNFKSNFQSANKEQSKHNSFSNKFRDFGSNTNRQASNSYQHRQSSSTSQNRQSSNTSQNNGKFFKCFRCDREGHLANSENCPARNKTCKSCSRIGHFAVVCKSKAKIRAVKVGKQISESIGDADSEDSEEDVWKISHKSNSSNETEVLIGKTPTKFVIDSGAGVNLLDSHSFNELSQKEDISLSQTDMKLYAYGSDKPLKLR